MAGPAADNSNLRAPDGIFDSRDLLLYVVVTPDGVAHMGGKTQDWEWVAQSLRLLAEKADAKARLAARGER